MEREERNKARTYAGEQSGPLVEYLDEAACGCTDPDLRMRATAHLLDYYTQQVIHLDLDRIAGELQLWRQEREDGGRLDVSTCVLLALFGLIAGWVAGVFFGA